MFALAPVVFGGAGLGNADFAANDAVLVAFERQAEGALGDEVVPLLAGDASVDAEPADGDAFGPGLPEHEADACLVQVEGARSRDVDFVAEAASGLEDRAVEAELHDADGTPEPAFADIAQGAEQGQDEGSAAEGGGEEDEAGGREGPVGGEAPQGDDDGGEAQGGGEEQREGAGEGDRSHAKARVAQGRIGQVAADDAPLPGIADHGAAGRRRLARGIGGWWRRVFGRGGLSHAGRECSRIGRRA